MPPRGLNEIAAAKAGAGLRLGPDTEAKADLHAHLSHDMMGLGWRPEAGPGFAPGPPDRQLPPQAVRMPADHLVPSFTGL